MEKCKLPDGIAIKPDGINDLDPCIYEFEEAYSNVIVQIVKCRKCGHREVLWYRTDDTQELSQEEMETIENGNT